MPTIEVYRAKIDPANVERVASWPFPTRFDSLGDLLTSFLGLARAKWRRRR